MNDVSTTPPEAAFQKSPFCNNIKDITGQKFGRLTVLRREGKNISGQATWRCLCECGNETVQAGSTLRAATVVSCGCFGVEARRAATKKHGQSETPFYKCFTSMRGRMQKGHKNAKNYHARGIKICERWNDFAAFTEDMLPKYEEAKAKYPGKILTLDRRDTDGNYEPNNCFFVTMKEQNNNKRNNVRITHNGETLTSSQWAERAGLSLPSFRSRRKAGWTMDEILSTPVRPMAKYTRKDSTS